MTLTKYLGIFFRKNKKKVTTKIKANFSLAKGECFSNSASIAKGRKEKNKKIKFYSLLKGASMDVKIYKLHCID